MAALLAQLQHVLQSWDGLATDVPASAGASAAAPSPSPAGDGDPLLLSGGVGGHGSSVVVPVSFFGSHGKDHATHTNNNNITLNGSRQALKQLELARAALALFTSNSGVYRPILQQLLSFVFEYLDFMVEDRSQLVLASGTATTALANLSESASINPADHDVVAAAYQKVRMVEAKMAALVEEASTQRDRYKAQLAILQQQVEKLEGLLVHQIELTHIIQDSHLEDKYGKRRNSDPKRGKDAAYVQRLIARAAREKALEELEEHVGQLTGEQEGLNTKILKLTRLNSRYARQAIEISARLSILRDHNVALASDAQLFQRDALLEQQKGSKLARDLTVLRNMFVTLLETRNREVLLSAAHTPSVRGMAPGRHNRAVLLAVANNSVGEDRLHMNSTRTSSIADMGTSYCEDRASTEPLDDDDAATNTTMMDQSMRSMTTVKALDKVDEAVGNIRDTILRQQLQDILQVNDRSSGGAVKGALLSVLNLKQASRDHFHQTMGGSPPRRGRGGHGRSRVDASRLSELRDHFWSAPYGTGVHIPPHLRSRHCVPLLSLHPLVAECFVHELLTQRQDLMDYAWKESIEVEAMNALSGIGNASSSSNATYIASTTTTTPPSTTANTKTKNNKSKSKAQVVSVAASAAAGVAAPAANSTTSNAPAKRSTKYGAIMPLGEFIELFVNVVWLNREERFAPLLPENVRKTLRHDKFALGGEDGASRASAGLEDGSKESAAVQNAVKWQLHCLIHTIRPPEDMLRLSDEGLRLTYALDAASRRPDAGFLTYAYGLCSRGVLGEMIFEVFRSERKVFMDMCHEVDQERADALAERRAAERAELIARRAQENGSVGGGSGERTPSPPRTTTSNNNNTNTEENERPRGRQRGCIPTVQLARILITMFPTYPVLKIEQLIIAATEDGTDSSESPVMVYYAVLLPERLLPGSVASSVEGSTFWREGSFAALFFTSICHDALESMQMVEDSVNHFVFTRNTQQRRGGEIGGLVSSTATAKQLSTFALSGIAGGELSHWGPCLRSILYRWNTLRATTAYSSRHRHDDDGGASGGGGGGNASTPAQLLTPKSGASSSSAATTSPTKTAAGKEVVASRIPVMDVMPFLRRFLVLRRGIHTLDSPSSFYDTERTSTAASPTKQQQQQQQQHSHGRQHAVPASGTSSAAEAPAAGSAESSESDDVLPEDSVALSATTSGVVMEPLFSWSGAQAEYIDALQRRWERYSDAAELSMEDDPIIFMARLRKYDPQRLRSWSTPVVAENNPLLRTMDWIYHEEEYHDHHDDDDEEEEEEEEDDEYEEEGPYAGEMAAKNATAAAAAANRSNLISGTRRTFMQPTSPGSPPPEVGNSALKQRAAGRMKTVSIVEVSSSSSSRQQRSSRPTTADEVCGERSPEMAPALPLSLPTSDRHDEHHDDDDDMPPMEASMATALPGGLVVGVAPLPSGPYSPDNSRVLGAPTMQQSAASLPDPRSITPPFDGAI